MNKYACAYKNPNSNIVGTSGQMYNEATKIEKNINYEDFGIYTNDNTYAVTFNHSINRPATKQLPEVKIKPPTTSQQVTKTFNEPPVALTENKIYFNNSSVKKPPLLPPYLNKPEDEGLIQGRTNGFNNGNIVYNHKNTINYKNLVY